MTFQKLNNINSLNGLRAIAILMVIFWHYFNCQISQGLLSGWIKHIQEITFVGWSGVDLFFVLSGFLIGRILIVHKESKNYFKTFYLRRIFRIFPAYYFVLVCFIIVSYTNFAHQIPWLTENSFPLYSYIFYIQNFWVIDIFGPNWLGMSWSLAVEEQFYLVLPLIIFIIKRKHLPLVLIFFIFLAPFCREQIQGLGSYVLLPARMDSLFIGVLIAYYYLNGAIQKIVKDRQKWLLLILTILIVVLYNYGPKETVGGRYIHTILALLFGTLLILALTSKNKFFISFLSNRVMSFLARISYMVYLTHQLFSGLLHHFLLNQYPKINNYQDAFVTLLALITTILFSVLSYYFFEKPILNLGKKYTY